MERERQIMAVAYGWGRPVQEVRDLTISEWNRMVEAHNAAGKRRGGG